MNHDLENVVHQALANAQATGRDYVAQTGEAVRVVCQVRPDITASEALMAVESMRQNQCPPAIGHADFFNGLLTGLALKLSRERFNICASCGD